MKNKILATLAIIATLVLVAVATLVFVYWQALSSAGLGQVDMCEVYKAYAGDYIE